MHKVRRLLALFLVALVLFTAACATDKSGSTSGGGGSQATAGAVKPELVVAVGKDNDRLAPAARANVATGYGDANAPVFEPLVVLAPDFSIKPLLATSWEFRAPNTWRFRLRPGVRFHNGAAFDAKAVAYNVTDLWGTDVSLSLGPSSAVVVDDLTIDLTPIKPNLRLVEQLVHPLDGIRAPGTYAGAGDTPESTPTGTGPFKFLSYRTGESLEVERFDGYWGERAKSQRIKFLFLPNTEARMLALQAGRVDAIYDFPREQAGLFAGSKELTTVKSPVGAYDALLLNIKGKEPYDILTDIRVRQAVAAGIDKATIVNNVWKGNAEVMNTVIPAPVLGASASMVKGIAFDLARARRLLDDAGWTVGTDGIRTKAGRRLQLTMLVIAAELQVPMPELVQGQLKTIGVDVKIEVPSDPAVYRERLEKGQGDMFAEVGNQNDGNPIFLGALFTAEPGGFADYAAAFGAGADYDKVFTKAIGSPDTDEVRRLAAQAMKIAVDDIVAVVPIAGISRIWGLRPNVKGFTPHASNVNQRWADVYVTL